MAVNDVRLLAPILACCGFKLLLFGALFAPAGLLSGNVLVSIGGLAVAVLLVALAVRSRKRCDGSCHVPALSAGGAAHRHHTSSTDRHNNRPKLDNEELP
jgi:hypothetical protein